MPDEGDHHARVIFEEDGKLGQRVVVARIERIGPGVEDEATQYRVALLHHPVREASRNVGYGRRFGPRLRQGSRRRAGAIAIDVDDLDEPGAPAPADQQAGCGVLVLDRRNKTIVADIDIHVRRRHHLGPEPEVEAAAFVVLAVERQGVTGLFQLAAQRGEDLQRGQPRPVDAPGLPLDPALKPLCRDAAIPERAGRHSVAAKRAVTFRKLPRSAPQPELEGRCGRHGEK